ncbi:putative membrane protein [Escherichia coli 2729250]|nr:hypothetical protein [Escherichia coli]EDX39031.1 hypothetical protein EC1011_4263 [Escherichia coli 101-1]EMV22429.1 putative membrane protein [Escherichia coli C-34666]EMV45741.1 putative membrane protein [Escherichia coli BCE019_MS-13]EMV96167.1 putative membrane protein [Escherichia coli 2860050]EMW55086.1 putative membrane protein [Escherichia coli 2770900]EMW69512.1 putative membrane protein [Escherichia coli 2749250]EMW76101.1 putative membrane protein [Escherichia coli 2747800]EM
MPILWFQEVWEKEMWEGLVIVAETVLLLWSVIACIFMIYCE